MKVTTIILFGAVVSSAVFMSTSVRAEDELVASICDYVAADDKNRLRKKLDDSRLKLRNVYDDILCGGNTLLRHAMSNNASNAGEFIVKQLPKQKLVDSGDFDWANANGHGGSAIAAAIKERAGL
ncbi:DUF3718 domain-containing protein [Pseudoalteromonas tunicata]|uniref:DUF3718 domain-containing protein n=1 Tax=Pseudoalteromonas tunicata D2 TaxID=87626 RepID=A4C913_9GAMM|nr:DUF3718 domain-containing protein [Pseudoalteromonas tunicata]ATC93579.1 hypothetical protein PTUN_a0862 [Pseudoalteromonas tunicata]AXT29418.1 DUF3718 domain-containing protein [Pseudoalteromonas tunicata]EAR29078.1 hypothetical protein PTD2_08539 [Pseudoalteromonas tunicata D2]MDP4983205.1 DUF3718 domain-containing protein [Pseudoalteromonas tunicata]MDP5211795.1 DUF3718 domain-containing protein [Pseudoalteromonas tunicata]